MEAIDRLATFRILTQGTIGITQGSIAAVCHTEHFEKLPLQRISLTSGHPDSARRKVWTEVMNLGKVS
jgi:hypothetical protein